MLNKFEDIRVAVIVALAEEYKLFCQYYHGRVVEKFHIGELLIDILERDDGSERVGLILVNQMGNVAAGIAVARLLEVFDLDVVVNIGLAAGVDSQKQSLGDLIIADKVRYYETGKVEENKFSVAPEYSNLRSIFVEALQTSDLAIWPLGASVGGKPRQVFFGTVASGEKVIAKADFVNSLLSHDRKIVGIEMESYGISAAISGRKEKLLLIRGICDFADEAKHDNARLSAMDGAVRFFDEAMRRGLLRRSSSPVIARPAVISTNYDIFLTNKEMIGGIANNFVQVERSTIIDVFKYRKSVIAKMASKFNLGELRMFCIALKIDFDEIRGETKTEKSAGIIELVEHRRIITIEELEALIDSD